MHHRGFILVTGESDPPDAVQAAVTVMQAFKPWVNHWGENVDLVAGACIGMDCIAAKIARENGWYVYTFLPANRDKVCRCWRAHSSIVTPMPEGTNYMQRNEAMVNYTALHAGVATVLAFPRTAHEERRSGTWATVRRAQAAGLLVEVHPLTGV